MTNTDTLLQISSQFLHLKQPRLEANYYYTAPTHLQNLLPNSKPLHTDFKKLQYHMNLLI